MFFLNYSKILFKPFNIFSGKEDEKIETRMKKCFQGDSEGIWGGKIRNTKSIKIYNLL